MISAWLQPILEARGALNSDGISRAARAGYCRRCGTVVMRGLDADRAALPVTTDPTPVNALGEFLAVASGLVTFDLEWRGNRYELNPRHPEHIQANPARLHARRAVVVAHSCGQRMPTEGLLANEPDVEKENTGAIPF